MGSKFAHMRSLAAFMQGGMKCGYCGVPTAATLEHVHPQSKGGRSGFENIMIACPYCNTRKQAKDVDEFKASGRWKMEYPPLPGTVEEMITRLFGWSPNTKHLATGSPHSRLKIIDQQCILEIRPGKRYEWSVVNLGGTANPAVVKAAYDFLKRHYTPPKPKYRSDGPWGSSRYPKKMHI